MIKTVAKAVNAPDPAVLPVVDSQDVFLHIGLELSRVNIYYFHLERRLMVIRILSRQSINM